MVLPLTPAKLYGTYNIILRNAHRCLQKTFIFVFFSSSSSVCRSCAMRLISCWNSTYKICLQDCSLVSYSTKRVYHCQIRVYYTVLAILCYISSTFHFKVRSINVHDMYSGGLTESHVCYTLVFVDW